MEWNYLSIPKLQRCSRWSLWMGKWFPSSIYNGCDYSSTLGLDLQIHGGWILVNVIIEQCYTCMLSERGYGSKLQYLTKVFATNWDLNTNWHTLLNNETAVEPRCVRVGFGFIRYCNRIYQSLQMITETPQSCIIKHDSVWYWNVKNTIPWTRYTECINICFMNGILFWTMWTIH